MLELVDVVLELLVEHHAIGNDDDAVEDAPVTFVVQRGEAVREPRNRVALSAAGRVLDEVVVPRAFGAGRLCEKTHRLKLVVAREDHLLGLHLAALIVALLVDLQMEEARQQVEQAVSGEHFFPQVGGAVAPALRVGRVARPAAVALVEGQEVGGAAREARCHEHRVGVDGEVHERALFELEDGLARVAVLLVLPPSVLDGLPGHRVL